MLAQKVTKHLGFFSNKICYQEIPKIVQSGHTDEILQSNQGFWLIKPTTSEKLTK